MKRFILAATLGLLGVFPSSHFATAANDTEGTLGPWRVGDMAYSSTLADDRPNDQSREIVAKNYKALVPDRVFKGEKGALSFRISPRNEGWAGILLMDQSGQPLPRLKSMRNEEAKPPSDGLTVTLSDAAGKVEDGKPWILRDTQILYSDASPIVSPKTRITVTRKKGTEVVDQVVVDFSQWKLEDSTIQMRSLLEGPTSSHGFVQAKDGAFIRDGKPMFFWGGHENHVTLGNGGDFKAYVDTYAAAYSMAGINVMRHMGVDEILADGSTSAVDKEKLDNFHYLIAKLGEKGIYFFITTYPGYANGMQGYKKGEEPPEMGKHFSSGGIQETFTPNFWINSQYREGWKKFIRTVFTAVNPYTGKALKDDPSVIGYELANETGMNERLFDFNRVDQPEVSRTWREAFNKYLLKKYGSREKLAEAWQTNPLRPYENPSKNTILVPSNYRGARSPYGGLSQNDSYATPRWYNNGWAIPAEANPRIVDAIEFNTTIAKKPVGFDFNNLSTPKETESLRLQFNEFLLKKYGSRDKLAEAWVEDPLFPWESPAVAIIRVGGRNGNWEPDPTKPQQTILIPTDYHGETGYQQATGPRIADPRVSDAMEFSYMVQKDWATDLSTFLKNDVGLKCGIGWNGDTFHVEQGPNHMANMDSPLDIAIAAAYMDSDNGDQLTSRVKNLKRFTAYGRILGRPMFAYEWGIWGNQGPFVYEYALLAALMGREYGFDGLTHHKMSPEMYPVSDPIYSLSAKMGDHTTPLTDRPRRGAFYLGQWIMARSKIQEDSKRLIVGFPYDDAFVGGPERKMSNWAFENWLMYQIGTEDYSFKDVYDGPTDRVVIHSGHGPYGDYRKAQHAILWCHSDSDREGKDPQAKEKWFALHGIKFAPGQKYFLNDQFFATTEDMTDYNVVHLKAEQARRKLLADNAAKSKANTKDVIQMRTANDDYWAAEPDGQPTELDKQLYAALKKWNYPMPFDEAEIDKVWRNRDRSMVMDTTKENFQARRDDMEMWFGRGGKGTKVELNRLSATTDERQYAVALLPWDTADFKTAKTLALWSMWNSDVTVKLPLTTSTKVYAVNWLGKRLFAVTPEKQDENSLTFSTARHDDIFCYEITR